MAITIKLKNGLNTREELWLEKNVGPRMHYIHNSIGGQGWVAKQQWDPGVSSKHWTLTLEDERYASFLILMFPQ